MASSVATLALAVVDWLKTDPTLEPLWDTPPEAMWTPDWTREGLSEGGRQCAVFPQGFEPALLTRGGGVGGDSQAILHIAVLLPMLPVTTQAARFSQGDEAVEAAEAILDKVLGTERGGWRCISAEHDPVISKDFARENRTWVSYLKTNWMRSE